MACEPRHHGAANAIGCASGVVSASGCAEDLADASGCVEDLADDEPTSMAL